MNVPSPKILQPLLDQTAAHHHHLCPRQVLGVRLGLCGLRHLGLVDEAYSPAFGNEEKRLLTIVETDGCGADGLAVATHCWVGRRTLRVVDYGKVAVTLVDTWSGRCLRLHPSPHTRQLASQYAPDAPTPWHAYLQAYQVIPDEELLCVRTVQLTQSLAAILSRPDCRAICQQCGEEIMNEREVQHDGRILCRACAGESYFRFVD